MIGRKLLHYEIVARIGAGGMGEVWRARDSRLEREVAIKVLPSDAGQAPTQRERFVREARAASALGHPNIITIHEINAVDGLDFIVMEYVRGEPLSGLLARGRMPTVRAIQYAIQIADALEAAHHAGIVHRDLKPGNIMVTASGLVKVLDFGIAKRLSDGAADAERTTAASLTVAGTTLGTPAYMSPEQILGDDVDARSDLFSLGVVLYEMLAGQLPFQGTTNLTLIRQIVHEPHRPLSAAAPEIPNGLSEIVDRCLEKNPERRYPDAALLRDQLRRCAAQLPSGDADPSEAETRISAVPATVAPGRRLSARTVRAAAIGTAALLLAVAAWRRGPAIVEWLRAPTTAQAQPGEPAASPQELYARAADRLRFHYREGNVDRGIEDLERALSIKSPYPLAEARLSLAYWRKNVLSADPEWQKRARAHAERAVAGNEQLAVTHIALGSALMLAGELDDAAAAYRRAETLDPGNDELLWRLGDLALAQKNTDGAERYYRRAVVSGGSEWEPHGKLGVFLYRQGRYKEAIAAFDKMRELAPDHPRSYSNLAAAYHQIGRTDESAAVLQRALAIAPDSLTFSNLGTYLYFEGKYPEAVRAFDEAVKLNANAYQQWGNLADAVRMTAPGSEKMHQSYRRAIQLAQQELATKPDDVAIRSSLAVYLARDGETAQALTEVSHLRAQKSLPPSALFNAALVHELANQRVEALGMLAQALDAGYRLREIRAEPDLVKLRADPEYHKLVSRYQE